MVTEGGRVDVSAEFDRRAASYDESALHQRQAGLAAGLADVRSGETVLDVATGTGLVLRAVASDAATTSVLVGVDTSAGMLREARRRGPARCRYVRASGAELPFRAGVFDVVTCVAGLPYLGDPVAALREWRRVCRPGARIVLTVPANGGITAFTLLRRAAAVHGVALSEPNAGLGEDTGRRGTLHRAGLLYDGVVEHIFEFEEPLSDDPETLMEHFVRYGHAEPLRTAPAAVRRLVLATYRDIFEQARRTGTHRDQYRVLYLRGRAPS